MLHALADQLAAHEQRFTLAAKELLAAARWSRTHDQSEGYRSVLARVLAHLGVDDRPLDP